MTLDLAADRAAIAAALTIDHDGRRVLTGHPNVPNRLVPPAAIVTEGTPYLEAGPRFGSWTINHQVDLVARPGTNQAMTAQLDELIALALDALEVTGAADALRVGEFYTLLAHDQPHLAATITVTGTPTTTPTTT